MPISAAGRRLGIQNLGAFTLTSVYLTEVPCGHPLSCFSSCSQQRGKIAEPFLHINPLGLSNSPSPRSQLGSRGGDTILENLEVLTLELLRKPGLILLSVTDRKDRDNHHSFSRPTGMGKMMRGKSLGKASGQVSCLAAYASSVCSVCSPEGRGPCSHGSNGAHLFPRLFFVLSPLQVNTASSRQTPWC